MAPSVAAVEITEIFDDIITNNLRYCAVCLRTENERKLVEPTAFLKCLSVLQLPVPVVSTICFACEAAAARAVALLQAVSFACVVNRWFKDMATKLRYKDEMPNHLDQYMKKHLQGSHVSPAGLAAGWAAARRARLVQTEVLVVSDAQTDSADRDLVEIVSVSGPPSPEPEPPHSDPAEILPHDTTDNQNIVIIEDEEEALPAAAAPPAGPLLLRPAPAQIPFVTKTHNGSPHFVLNPTMYSVGLPRLTLRPAPQPPQPPGGTLTPLIQNVMSTPAGACPPGAGPPGLGCGPRPVHSGRIDWEDKIPMDVISFVDATDPYADQLLNPESPPAKRAHQGYVDLC